MVIINLFLLFILYFYLYKKQKDLSRWKNGKPQHDDIKFLT